MVTHGGTNLKNDIMRLYQTVHIVVGTPGRILDLAMKGSCILNNCSTFVMDEVGNLSCILNKFFICFLLYDL